VTLTISCNGCYDDSLSFVLERPLPNLKMLQLVDVSWDVITLNEELTPNLTSLRLQNVPDECHLEVRLPKLEYVSIHYWGGPEEIIHEMLEMATVLEEFDSYKLWVGKLSFASNELHTIDLHRSDSLGSLTIWAPNLRSLSVQGCYSLDKLRFLESHPLKAQLPRGHKSPQLEVNAENAALGRVAKKAIDRNPNVVKAPWSYPSTMGATMQAAMESMGTVDSILSESTRAALQAMHGTSESTQATMRAMHAFAMGSMMDAPDSGDGYEDSSESGSEDGAGSEYSSSDYP